MVFKDPEWQRGLKLLSRNTVTMTLKVNYKLLEK